MSRIDGALDEQELAVVAGMTPDEVGAMLDQLALLGAIELAGDEAAADASRAPPPPPRPSSPGPAQARHAGGAAHIPTPPPPSASADGIELDPAKRQRVDDLWGRLDDLTYYELLGVGVVAEKKAIKSAYYALAPDFHPDKYFRKQLGPYRHKIEAIFARLTLAHDVLTAQKRRAEYDAYLEQTRQNRSMSEVLEQTPAEVEAILEAVERAAAQSMARTATPAPPQVAPVPSAPPPPVGPSPQEILRQRREALARKLVGGGRLPSAPQSRPASSVPPRPDPAVAARAAEALRTRTEAAAAEAKRTQVQKYMEAGRAALERQDWPAAANSYRIAAALVPDDAAVQATCGQALQKVAAALADGYWKQGIYEEGQERWAEAALSFSKVCAGRPDSAIAHERVAYTTLKSSTNYRRAVEFARKAIELDPRKPEFRVTLARAYAAAGLEKSAQSELDRALELAPKDPRVVALVSAARTSIAAHTPAAPAVAAPPPPPSSPGVPAHDARVSASRASGAIPVPNRAPGAGAPGASGDAASPTGGGPQEAPRKSSGIHAFVSAVRSALAPKEDK